MIAERTEEIVINGIALEELGKQIKVENNCDEFINIDEDVALSRHFGGSCGQICVFKRGNRKRTRTCKNNSNNFIGHNMCRGLATVCGGRRECKWNSN